ncbi:glutamate synthase-related protein [Bacillus solimangrovi]|uniref:Glutamate synthase n=1 Tax=Bacillus solimangrovi TaxID=1305675 RepID=A0A1E5LBE4_9BACI|nr:glutamate synthase-related protein [Bacillus solimangrovi]OEH91403.1 glutamate synthase [Bacillus solimangrovi]
MKKKWSPASFENFNSIEHDSCGIVSCIEKQQVPTKKNIDNCINALVTMNHRAGFINGEGDGVGIHIDIPIALWKEKLSKENLDASLVDRNDFSVGHFFLNKSSNIEKKRAIIDQLFSKYGLNVIFETDKVTNSNALGPLAKREEPVFWQVAFISNANETELSKKLFELTIEIEQDQEVHVASLSNHHAVYKVMGAGDILPKFYADLANEKVASTMTLGHNRYSTNTASNFFRVQPFSVIGHNGEINTISKLRDEAEMVDVPLTHGGSDSQDLDRTLHTFISREGYSLFEAADILFPPIINEIKSYPNHLQDLYTYIREAWGHFAQGPAGIISRFNDEAVFSVDSLGLRPVWKLETESSYLFSSEPGILPSSEYTGEPKPFAPGEKVGLKWKEDGTIKVYDHHDYQAEVYKRMNDRLLISDSRARLTPPTYEQNIVEPSVSNVHNGQYAAFGWEREQIQLVEQMAEKGAEPIRSLGHDASLAAINSGRQNIADYIKESVAVVTNPAIDRDREAEHFSTRTILGKRPSLFQADDSYQVIELNSPILIEGKAGNQLAKELEQPSYTQLLDSMNTNNLAKVISVTFTEDETVPEAIERLINETEQAIDNGANFIILDDTNAHTSGNLWLDPMLVTSAIDQGLVDKNKRRNCALILRSGALRSLHDLIVAFGLGADALSPYLMFTTVHEDDDLTPSKNLFNALNKGLEKVISTIGIHELRGYDRLFSSIGLNEDIANTLKIVNFFGSSELEYNFTTMKEDSLKRAEDYSNEQTRPGKTFHVLPRIWKSIGEMARSGSYEEYREKVSNIEDKNPTTIRHLTGLKESDTPIEQDSVDISIAEHDLPFIISSMSFGSQNETAFRSYAEAADRLNMISLNGEGGEIKDMLGKYPKTRGQQVASGRFGVNAELLNSSNLLEIKIGQGAKPGEGGHLPGSKVTAKIAEARNATIGSDLISPSNNHDIYSIEDLEQMISELKTANDQAKVIVKVPIVPNIGTIAVGIAKAGADMINLSGFDGGTGAARVHALQNVGLPVEIGVKAAHNALLEAGMRHNVELWADGGLKSAEDVLKVMLLGANRVGFGTLSMVAVGCTTCRGCHLDTCHVGIATQIESEAQAKEHGLRRFVPRQYAPSVEGLMNLFTAFGNELKSLVGSLGFDNLQDVVGRSDLLEQTRGIEQMNLNKLLERLDIENLVKQEVASALDEEKLAVALAAGAEYLDYEVNELNTSREFIGVTSEQRVLGGRVSCHRVRGKLDGSYRKLPDISLKYLEGSIPGNGLGAYNTDGIDIHVVGGAQDGIGKTAFGGGIFIFKAKGKNGHYFNGSVGKGFGYGAQKGSLFIQGNADSRAGIRLSGADMLIGGRITKPIPKQEHGNIGINANIKGFAFEYMTNGRGLVLGDPGPWICAGMTGGVIYVRHQPEMGLTKEALQRRIAKGAKVAIQPLGNKGRTDVTEMLDNYVASLRKYNQVGEADTVEKLLENLEDNFLQIIPEKEQADPSIATE